MVTMTRTGGLRSTLALGAAVVAGAAGAAHAAEPQPLPAQRVVESDRMAFTSLAEDGLVRTQERWWNADAGWYKGALGGDPQTASLWWAFPLLEATAATAIAEPTPANEQRVEELFAGAERYWDPTLENGAGGVAAGWGVSPSGHAFFDDAGWWGVAYLDAYRATQDPRWLADAAKALEFIDRFGWDPRSGGTWWDTSHEKKTSEPLAAGTLIAATLYRIQHKPQYLAIATKYLQWADAKTRNLLQGDLYGRNATDGTVMDYVEGMMIAAHVELCVGTKQESYCRRAEQLADASLQEFPVLADWAPETDVVYLRGLLRLYQRDRDPRWYAVVYANAKRALLHARDAEGLWSKRWDGGWTQPGVIYTQAATLELFAWAATDHPPPP